ncbi:uncharacterized protein LOC141901789 [Tubulanus polymorphus]|uniref:uncharacterized protein LOC141901789 n=1 Tax=Tubulanus polymorphus TaxID=672921 RepID=UPI003DA20D39
MFDDRNVEKIYFDPLDFAMETYLMVYEKIESDFPTTSEQCGDTIFKGQFIPGIVTSHLESARKRVYSSLGESARNNRKNKSKVSKVCRQRSYKCISCGFKCASQSAMGDHQVDKHLEQYMEEIGVESSEPPSSDDDLTSYVDVSTNLKEVIEISSDDCTDDVMNGITNSDEIMNLPSNSTNSTDVSDCIVISDDSEENDDTRSVPMKLYNGDEQLPIFKEGKELDIDTNNHKGLQVKRCEVRLAVFRNHKGLQVKRCEVCLAVFRNCKRLQIAVSGQLSLRSTYMKKKRIKCLQYYTVL